MTTPSSEPLISLSNVTKRFGDKTAVDRLDLTIASGEVFAFLGPNGAGKTTTIKLMTGLLRPDAGRVTVMGRDMASDSVEARRPISYVPDQPHLYEKLTARDFLEFTRKIYGIDDGKVADYQEELIDLFDLRGFLDDLCESYSHGMRQRVVFAAAMLHRPKILILDEPMVGLDPRSMKTVKNLMRKTADEGAAVFVSTHTLSMVEEIADRVGIINRGQLLRCASLTELESDRPVGMSLEDYFLTVTNEERA